MLGLLALVLRGIWPMLRASDDDAMPHLFRGIALLILTVILRALWWDVVPVLVHQPLLGELRAMIGGRPGANFVIIAIGILAALSILRGLWRLIPSDERGGWSIWTAPFYPRRWLMWRRKQ